jgi:hypothetical protein
MNWATTNNVNNDKKSDADMVLTLNIIAPVESSQKNNRKFTIPNVDADSAAKHGRDAE